MTATNSCPIIVVSTYIITYDLTTFHRLSINIPIVKREFCEKTRPIYYLKIQIIDENNSKDWHVPTCQKCIGFTLACYWRRRFSLRQTDKCICPLLVSVALEINVVWNVGSSMVVLITLIIIIRDDYDMNYILPLFHF